MADHTFILDYLDNACEELDPKEFYREIFPYGELEDRGIQEVGKYNAIAVELLPEEERAKSGSNARRYILTNDFFILDKLLESENFIIISPISYAGKSRQANNARYIYALAVDLDGIDSVSNLVDLFHQIEKVEYIPKPTFFVWSGTGLHLYYQFEKPIPCFKNITKQLSAMKEALTYKIWNGFVTSLANKPQIQSLFQGFRLVGGVTKGGNRTRAFRYGDKVSIAYLNEFIDNERDRVKDFTYKSSLTIKEAQEKYPEWYDNRIVNNQPRGSWVCKRDLYDWWKRRLYEIQEGHRYYGVMCLAIYAKKSGIDKAELEEDAFGLVAKLDNLTTQANNHFTREDVLAALEMFNDNYFTFPIDSIEQLTNLRIEKNKRNYQKQEWHLEDMRSKKANMKRRGQKFKNPEGRPSKAQEVIAWRRSNPDGTKKDCMDQLRLGKSTVYKYWNEVDI